MIYSAEEFHEAMDEASVQQLLIVDTEFEKVNQYGAANIIGVSWGFPLGSHFKSYYAPFRHRDFPGTWNLPVELLQEFNRFPVKGTQVYHNWLADHKVFLKDGIDFSDRTIFDTMIGAHLVDENELAYGLDYLAMKKFKARKVSLTDLEKLVGWEHIHPLVMGKYACTDVFLTYMLYRDVVAGLQQEELVDLYEGYEAFFKVLFKVIDRGLVIDEQLAIQLQEDGRKELDKLRSRYDFNLGSMQKVGQHLHETLQVPVRYRTAKGAPSTSSLHLRRYTDSDERAREFTSDVLRYRTISKAVTTWYEGFLTKRGSDGLLHPGLTIVGADSGGTRTGRLSCREPNLQQIPRKGSTRRLFKDPVGKRLIELDYSQAELRLTGYYMNRAGDSTVVDSYIHDKDIHSITADSMGLTSSMSFKDARQVGKTCNFSLCYRAGPAQLQNILYRDANFTCTMAQANEWHLAWHRSYPVIVELNERAQEQARKNGYVRMWSGRRRHLQGNDCFKAYNSVIQGGVGQLMVMAMTEINKKFPALQMVNQVHDSIWFYMDDSEIEHELPKVVEIMERFPSDRFDMPFKVDWKYWTNE